MLEHLGEREAAEKIRKSVAEVIREGKSVTYDFKENRDDPTAVGTREMADAVVEKIRQSDILNLRQ
jgi:isocitrate dehydrogenase (NAD+)